MKFAATGLIAFGVLSTSFASFANDYFPYSGQDYSTYKNNYGQEVTTKIVDTYGDSWMQLSEFLGQKNQWISTSPTTQKIYWFTEQGSTRQLVDFTHSIGTIYQVSVNDCSSHAKLENKGLTLETAAGVFSNVVELSFSGNCADAGLSNAYFSPQAGLIRWDTQSIAGPVTYDLTTAKINGVTYPKGTGVSVSSNVESGKIFLSQQQKINAYIELNNVSEQPVELTFNSGQTFEIEIFDESGVRVAYWSQDKMFTEAIHTITLQPGESKMFGDVMPLVYANEHLLQQGNYQVKVKVKGYDASAYSYNPNLGYEIEFPISIQ